MRDSAREAGGKPAVVGAKTDNKRSDFRRPPAGRVRMRCCVSRKQGRSFGSGPAVRRERASRSARVDDRRPPRSRGGLRTSDDVGAPGEAPQARATRGPGARRSAANACSSPSTSRYRAVSPLPALRERARGRDRARGTRESARGCARPATSPRRKSRAAARARAPSAGLWWTRGFVLRSRGSGGPRAAFARPRESRPR